MYVLIVDYGSACKFAILASVLHTCQNSKLAEHAEGDHISQNNLQAVPYAILRHEEM